MLTVPPVFHNLSAACPPPASFPALRSSTPTSRVPAVSLWPPSARQPAQCRHEAAYTHSHTLTHPFTRSHTPSLLHSFTHSFTHAHAHTRAPIHSLAHPHARTLFLAKLQVYKHPLIAQCSFVLPNTHALPKADTTAAHTLTPLSLRNSS